MLLHARGTALLEAPYDYGGLPTTLNWFSLIEHGDGGPVGVVGQDETDAGSAVGRPVPRLFVDVFYVTPIFEKSSRS